MKVTVTKHTSIKLSRKELDTLVEDKLSEIYPDLDRIQIIYDVDHNGTVLGATGEAHEKE